MTLEEAIIHAEEVADEKMHEAESWEMSSKHWGDDKNSALDNADQCRECAEEHRQLAEWLKELKELKDKMIHCRDCAWWVKQIDSLQGRCVLHQTYPTGSYYCGSAERKHDDRQE